MAKEKSEKAKKIKKGIIKAGVVLLTLTMAFVALYTTLKFTVGPGNKTNAPGSRIESHRIYDGVNNGTSGEVDSDSEEGAKGDWYYESKTPINNDDKSDEGSQEDSEYHRRDTDSDEVDK